MTKTPIKRVVGATWVTAFISACAIATSVSGGSCPDPTTSGVCLSQPDPGSLGVGGVFLVIYVILAIVGWILGLVKTAQIGRWGWFIAIFLTSVIGLTIYAMAGPEEAEYNPPIMPATPYNPYGGYSAPVPPAAYTPSGGYPPSAPPPPAPYPPSGGYPPASPPSRPNN